MGQLGMGKSLLKKRMATSISTVFVGRISPHVKLGLMGNFVKASVQ
jgi:hypothetical protein